VGTRCLRKCCCWLPVYPDLVAHPLALDGLAMLHRLYHVRLVERTAAWRINAGLRSRILFEKRLRAGLWEKEFRPVWATLERRLWSINEDYFRSRHWNYFVLDPVQSWVWVKDPVASQAKLVGRLQKLESLTLEHVAPVDPLYAMLTLVPTMLPLSDPDATGNRGPSGSPPERAGPVVVDRRGRPRTLVDPRKHLPRHGADSTENGQSAGRDAAAPRLAEEAHPPVDEKERLKALFEDRLLRNEAFIVWECTSRAVFCYVIYKDYPPAKDPGYEKHRVKHSAVYIKLLITGQEKRTAMEHAVQGYLEVLHEQSFQARRDSFQPQLSKLARTLNLDQIIGEIPGHIKALGLIPCPDLDLVPLHALPLGRAGSELVLDRFDVRYVSSLPMVGLTGLQQAILLQETPWFLTHLCILEVSITVNARYPRREQISVSFPMILLCPGA
jgi:hypothetical protein